jgi:AraC-like DNA-binding protein
VAFGCNVAGMNYNMNHVTVSAVAVVDLARELLELNVIGLDQVRACSLDLRVLVDDRGEAQKPSMAIQELRVDESILIELWKLASQSDLTDTIGFLIGNKVNKNAKGILANLLCQASNLQEAFTLFTKNILLLNPSERWQVTTTSSAITLTFDFLQTVYPRCALERSMVALISWSEYLSGRKLNVISAQFQFDKNDSAHHYQAVFGNNIQFNCPRNQIVLAPEVFTWPIQEANSYIKGLMSERVALLLTKLKDTPNVVITIRQIIQKDIPTYCQIGAVCDFLHMSRATLYRRLKAQNTSYSEILNEVRRDYVEQADGDKLSAEMLSEQLGFADTSAFYKAYKRWFPTVDQKIGSKEESN